MDASKKSHNIYLYCYDRLFAIKSRDKNTYSYDLSADQAEMLKTLFNNLGIPFKELNDDKCFIDRPYEFDPTPANSRVVIEIAEEQFNIMNYNIYLIKEHYAKKITEAFLAKGLSSRVELMGQYANKNYVAPFKEEYRPVIEKPEVRKEVKPVYVQASIFDISA